MATRFLAPNLLARGLKAALIAVLTVAMIGGAAPAHGQSIILCLSGITPPGDLIALSGGFYQAPNNWQVTASSFTPGQPMETIPYGLGYVVAFLLRLPEPRNITSVTVSWFAGGGGFNRILDHTVETQFDYGSGQPSTIARLNWNVLGLTNVTSRTFEFGGNVAANQIYYYGFVSHPSDGLGVWIESICYRTRATTPTPWFTPSFEPPTRTPSRTPSPAPSLTPSVAPSPTQTRTPTDGPTPTPTNTGTPGPSPTALPSPTGPIPTGSSGSMATAQIPDDRCTDPLFADANCRGIPILRPPTLQLQSPTAFVIGDMPTYLPSVTLYPTGTAGVSITGTPPTPIPGVTPQFITPGAGVATAIAGQNTGLRDGQGTPVGIGDGIYRAGAALGTGWGIVRTIANSDLGEVGNILLFIIMLIVFNITVRLILFMYPVIVAIFKIIMEIIPF